MFIRNFSKRLRTATALALTLALGVGATYGATPAQGANVDIPATVHAATTADTIQAFQDVAINVTITGCYAYGSIEENIAGVWTVVQNGGWRLGDDNRMSSSNPCASETTSDQLSLYTILGVASTRSLPIGQHTYRLKTPGWYEYWSSKSEYVNISAAESATFSINVIKAQTTITGWNKKTISVKPGAAFTIPQIAITNPGGTADAGTSVIVEKNYGFGWVCLYQHSVAGNINKKDCGQETWSNSPIGSDAAKNNPPGKTWTQQIQYRVRVIPTSGLATGATSPIITVKFNKGVTKSKPTKTTVKVATKPVYGKKGGTFKGVLNNKKATGVIGFVFYTKLPKGYYEEYWPTMGGNVKKGVATYKYFSTKLLERGTYYVVAVYQSNKPAQFLSSASKPLKIVVK